MNYWAAYKNGNLCLEHLSTYESAVWDSLIKMRGQTNLYSDMLKFIGELKAEGYRVSEISITEIPVLAQKD